jgi:tetratricopeptide (TPR) repeat protein
MTGSARISRSQAAGRYGAGCSIFSVFLLSLALAACAATSDATTSSSAPNSETQINFRTQRDCFEPLDYTNIVLLHPSRDASRLQSVADTCAAAAQQEPRSGLLFAYFYAGWANAALGAGPIATLTNDVALAPANLRDLSIDQTALLNPQRLSEATRLLEISARMAARPGADADTRRAGQRARLELARAYRLLGLINEDQFGDAQRELTALERDGAGELRASLSYEQAMFILNRLRSDQVDEEAQLLSALQELSVFSNLDPNPRDLYIVERGPTQLARLALFMGNRALSRQPQTLENTQLALRHYRDAVGAYNVLQRMGGATDPYATARMRVRMGLINLRMANLLVEGQLAEFGCAPGADPYAISEAEANFSAARQLNPQSADAHWGLGCALMARNNANLAVSSFRQSVALLNASDELALPRGDYYLGLARALALTGEWDGPSGAVANFQAALAGQTDRTRIASIQFEIGRIYAENQRWAPARENLEAAVRAHPDAQAYILLGEILYDHPQLEAGMSAREALREAVAIAGPHQPRANYRLALVEQRAGNGARAVAYATTAATGDRTNRDYRLLACQTRIIFGLTRDQGQAYCAADASDREAYARNLLYEGMFWLRQAYHSSGGNQRSYWAQSLLAFERGLDEAGGRSQLVEGQSLQPLLAYGRRFALHCAGLGAAVQAEPGDAQSDGERRFFTDRYRLDRCWR